MTTVEPLIEVHRLAVAGREPAIAHRLERVLAPKWLLTSRFTDAANLASLTLTPGPDASRPDLDRLRALLAQIEQAARENEDRS
ncbi:hypothetical protein GCM10010112_78470 [Actinoplanes lobatus]|uniref:Uncharacterized protein n=1 Tax=Actinoplanes lobatus TaxID=113568 RepID=A0A7W7HMZ0_9ACTN|nr:hypothetical protein [Actinoplanes lobatus]MBB4753485.1 hypothetical protein [Actinoplanes lobatus]GGN91872.1 hypothetical protein GCM10010112_78470 [Actinoplanes lobatus]GIE38019.1 hypothetical protein Alo02nite_09170 [Actinoplanes lobatus]